MQMTTLKSPSFGCFFNRSQWHADPLYPNPFTGSRR